MPYSVKSPCFEQNLQEDALNYDYTSKGLRIKTRADMDIPGGLLFMWGVTPSFRLAVLVAASHKTQFQHSKNGKHAFCGMKRKTSSMVLLAVPKATRLSDM
jgi:hypothetical protein